MSRQLEAIGGIPPYIWSAIDALPAGLSLSSTGLVTGTPTNATAGGFYTVQVTDAAAATATIALWLEVVAIAPAIPVVQTMIRSLAAIAPQIETRWQSAYRNAAILNVALEVQTIWGAPSGLVTVIPEIETLFSPGVLDPPSGLVTVIPEIETLFNLGGGGGS